MPVHAESCFFRLPRELRAEIYRYVLETTAEVPANPSCASCASNVWEVRSRQWKRSDSNCATSPALLVCRQMRAELQDDIASPKSTGTARVDLDMMANGLVFYPTWTYIPPCYIRPESPYDLHVALRIFSTEAFQGMDGRPHQHQPGPAFRFLLAMLTDIVQRGPTRQTARGTAQSHPFLINRLDVRISFHDDYTPSTHPSTVKNLFRALKALATDGVAGVVIKEIHARAQYVERGLAQEFERTWEVCDHLDPAKARAWGRAGFYYSPLVV